MDGREKEKDVEKLTRILSLIQNLYHKKKEQLEDLQTEIEELKMVLNDLNSFISTKSFQSADEIYNKLISTDKGIPNGEAYFSEEIEEEKVKGTIIKRKIFSEDKENRKEGELLCILKFIDFNKVEIKFINPEERNVKEASENFIKTFLKDALIEIKNHNPNLNKEYKYYKNTDIIESIQIHNLKTMDEYDLITSKLKQLLCDEIS